MSASSESPLAAAVPAGVSRLLVWTVAGLAALAVFDWGRTVAAQAFPRLTAPIVLLLAIGLIIVGVSVAHQLRLGRRYSLINVYCGIFVSEFVIGTLVATSNADILAKTPLSSAVVTQGLALAVGGLIVLLAGYHLPSLFPGKTGPPADRLAPPAADFPSQYRLVLFVFLGVTIALGFVHLVLRIQQAGGFAAYLAVAYTLRYGTYADNDVSNAGAVLASMLATGALPAAALLYIAWMRGRLTRLEKWLLVALTAILLARQASTAFRAVVVFTLISAFAVYDSERRVSTKRLLMGGAAILLALIVVNYAHVMLHTITGMGQVTSFSEASEELLAPHGYLQTLSSLIDARERLEGLSGSGILTAILFFVPRAIWSTKVPSDEYGTGLVQGWAGLPTHYQMAITNVGELFAQFGTIGLLALLISGLAYRYLDDKWWSGVEWRVALLCIAVPRVFPDAGMGISAFMISMMSLAMFIVPLGIAKRIGGVTHSGTQ